MALKRRANRAAMQVFGMAFLDVISCGFGAITLLLIVAKNSPDFPDQVSVLVDAIAQPEASSTKPIDYSQMIKVAQHRIYKQRERLDSLKQEKIEKQKKLDVVTQQVNQIREEVKKSSGSMDSQYQGGIPVGDTHIIFVIDTSGSMIAKWATVVARVNEFLEAHPRVKGMQVLSDMGDTLIPGYEGMWIPDNPAARKNFQQSLSTMSMLSNSSPVEGIEKALRVYAKRDVVDDLSIYVLGDDFTGNSYDQVLDTINDLNTNKKGDGKIARIHGIGFPGGIEDRFGTLMRAIAEENNGVFVGL